MIGLLWSVWGWIWGLPAPIIAIVFFAAFSLTLFTNNQLANRKIKAPPPIANVSDKASLLQIEFYENKEAFQQVKTSLEMALRDSSTLWVSLIGTKSFDTLGNKKEIFQKIKRMILIDPTSDYMKALSSISSYKRLDFPSQVKDMVKLCEEWKTPLKVSSAPVMYIIISDPDSPNAWAHIRLFLPHVEGAESPILQIYKQRYPKSFDVIRQYFTKMWDEGKSIEEALEAPQWVIPDATNVLQAINSLKKSPFKADVRILSSKKGRLVANLLVQIFQLAEWTIQENSVEASCIFPLGEESVQSGICLKSHSSESEMALLILDLLMVMQKTINCKVDTQELFGTVTKKYLQIEVGSYPFEVTSRA